MTINVSHAFKNGVDMFATRLPMLCDRWADKYFYLSKESSGSQAAWKCYPYQRALLNWMTSDDIEIVSIIKSRRIGYTKCLLASMGFFVEQLYRNIVLWQPKDADASNFVKKELEPMLRDVPIVGDLLSSGVDKKSKYNTLNTKVFSTSVIDIRGGKSPANYRAMTKDVAMYDELAAFDPDVSAEGSPTVIGDGRLDQATFPKSIRGSTPKIKNVCLIEAAVKDADAIYYRFLPCPQCGTYQRLEFEQLKWEDNDPKTVSYVCSENGCVIKYKEYKKMDDIGQWRTLEGCYYDDQKDIFFNAEDEKITAPRHIGAKIWAGYSRSKTWAYIAGEWITASKKAKTGDKSYLKAVVNQLLGETWEEKGESVAATGFMNHLEEYYFDSIPNEVLVITAGVDIQGGLNARVELEILGHGFEGESWSIDYVIIKGEFDEQSTKDHLDDQLARKFTRQDGIELGVAGMFVDSGYNTTEVYKYTGPRRGKNVFATKGVNTGTICNKGSWQADKNKKHRAILRTVNVDETKETIFKRLKKDKGEPGYCHFPAHYDQNFFDQFTNEEKKEKRRAGRLVGYEWVIKKQHLGNEPLDCRSYNLGCIEWLNPNFAKIKMRIDRKAAALDETQEVTQEEMAPSPTRQKKKLVRKTRRGFVNGWK